MFLAPQCVLDALKHPKYVWVESSFYQHPLVLMCRLRFFLCLADSLQMTFRFVLKHHRLVKVRLLVRFLVVAEMVPRGDVLTEHRHIPFSFALMVLDQDQGRTFLVVELFVLAVSPRALFVLASCLFVLAKLVFCV